MESQPTKQDVELHTTTDTLGRDQHFLINPDGVKNRISQDEFDDFQTGVEVNDGAVQNVTSSELLPPAPNTAVNPSGDVWDSSAKDTLPEPSPNDQKLFFPGTETTATTALTKEDGSYYTYGEAINDYNSVMELARSIDLAGKSKVEIKKILASLEDEAYKFNHYIGKAEGVTSEKAQKTQEQLGNVFKNLEKQYEIENVSLPTEEDVARAEENTKRFEKIAQESRESYLAVLTNLEHYLQNKGRKDILNSPQARKAYLQDLKKLHKATIAESIASNQSNDDVEEDVAAIFYGPKSEVFKYGVRDEELVEAGILTLDQANPIYLNEEQLHQQNREDLKGLNSLAMKEKQEGPLSDEEKKTVEQLYRRLCAQNSIAIFGEKRRGNYKGKEREEKEKIFSAQLANIDAVRDGKAKLVEVTDGTVNVVMLTGSELAGYGRYSDTGVNVSDGQEFSGTYLDRATDPDRRRSKSRVFGRRKNEAQSDDTDRRSNKKKYAALAAAAIGAVGIGVVANEILDDSDSQSVDITAIDTSPTEGYVPGSAEEVDRTQGQVGQDEMTADELTPTENGTQITRDALDDAQEAAENVKQYESQTSKEISELDKKIEELEEMLSERSTQNSSEGSGAGDTQPRGDSGAVDVTDNDQSSAGVDDELTTASTQDEPASAETASSAPSNEGQANSMVSAELINSLRQENLSQYTYPWDWAQAHDFNIREMVAQAQAKGLNFSWNLQSGSDRDDILLYNGSDNTTDVLNALIDSLDK